MELLGTRRITLLGARLRCRAGRARVPAARLRHQHRARRAHAGRAVLLRHELDALRRLVAAAAGAGRWWSLKVLPAIGLARRQALPDRAPRRVPASRPRPRRRLQHHPVDDRRRLRRHCAGAATWPRRRRWTSCPSTTPTSSSPWSASATASSGAAVLIALYVLLIWRALRIATLARDMYGSIMAGGIAVVLAVPGVREHRHDNWYHAGDRYPVAVHELRWRGADHEPACSSGCSRASICARKLAIDNGSFSAGD